GAVQIGHGLWMVLGVVVVASAPVPVAAGQLMAILIEAFLFIAAAATVVFWPHLILIGLLTAYQAVAACMNVLGLFQPGLPEPLRVAIIVNLFLRVLAVAMMFEAYFAKTGTSSVPILRDDESQGEWQPRRKPRPVPWGLIGLVAGILVVAIAVAIYF